MAFPSSPVDGQVYDNRYKWNSTIGAWRRVPEHPVGSHYIQYPDANSNDDATEFPTTQRPASLFGGTWAEQWSTESVFFRTRGTEADDGRVDGRQLDQMQRMTGYMRQAITEGPTDSGVISISQTSSTGADGNTSGRKRHQINFDSLNSPDARASATTDGETRVTNRRIKIWKRTA